MAAAAFRAVDNSGFIGFMIVASVTGGCFLWIKLHNIKLGNGTIYYRSGLGLSSKVDISNGFRAKSVAKTGGVWGWMVKMPRNFYSVSNGKEEVLMNLKPFSRQDIRKIRELLPEHKT